MTNFTVIDAIMGSGKTTYMIDHLNQAHAEDLGRTFVDDTFQPRRFIYVTPTLDEVDRITDACPSLDFRNPQRVEGRKLRHLSTLVSEGRNICTTHALFSMMTPAIAAQIAEQNYVLVIDEVLSAVEIFDRLTAADRKTLDRNGFVYVEQGSRRLRWNDDRWPDYRGRFEDIKNLCDNGSLVAFRDTMLLWEFPTDFLRAFAEVFILTYLFEGSVMASMLKAERVEYDQRAVRDGRLVEWSKEEDAADKAALRPLVHIYEGPANRLGQNGGKENRLSSSWLKRKVKADDPAVHQLRVASENFFKRHARTPSAQNGWTTFKHARRHLKGDRYTRGFIPINAKATNDHIERRSLAYLANVFYHPYLKAYFEEQGVVVDEDAYALSELVQWVWRSQIRRGDPVQVFIPSERMRGLLREWLEEGSSRQISAAAMAQVHRIAA